MSKTITITSDMRWILDDIIRIQAIYEEAIGKEDQILARLHSYDLTRLWERLHVTTCEVCYHGRNMANPMQECHWWDRCRSYLITGEVTQLDEITTVIVRLVFEIE